LIEYLPNKIKSHLLITPLINLEKHNEKYVISIDILLASFPIFYNGKIFVRSGSTTQELTGLELSSFLLEKPVKLGISSQQMLIIQKLILIQSINLFS